MSRKDIVQNPRTEAKKLGLEYPSLKRIKRKVAKKMGDKDAVKEQRKKESRNAYIFS